jgi:hypothetical protein
MRPLLVLPLTLLLAGIALLAAPPARAQDETVQAIPPGVTPEAVLEARAQTSRAGTYFLTIRVVGAGPLRQSAPLSPDAAGVVAARLLIGNLAVGSYSLVLSAGTPTGAALASTPLTIIPSMSVKAIPDPARAGDPLVAEVGGLQGGTVRILLDGAPVATQPAQPGTMLVPFTLPSNLAPGSRPALEALNFDGDQLIGVGRSSVRVASIPFTGAARLVNLTGLASVLEVNRPFDITGRVELRRGTPQGLQARLVARLPGGRTLVLDDGRGVVAANGDFRIRGTPPSLWNGAPVVLSQLLGTGQGDFAIVLVDPQVGEGRRGATFTFPQGPRSFSDPDAVPVEFGLNVRVRDPNGQPVPDVVVTLFGDPGAELVAEDPALAARGGAGVTTSSPTLIRAGTQIGQVLQQVAPAVFDKLRFECPITLYRNKTDIGGNVQVRLSPIALLLAQIESLNADIIDGSPDHDTNIPLKTSLRLRLSPLGAGANGFTFADTSNIAQAAETYLTFDHRNGRWCFESVDFGGCTQFLPGGTVPTLTYTVRPYTGQTVLPITPILPGLPKREVESLIDRYGPITSFPGAEFNDVDGLGIAGGLPVGFAFDQLLFGILQDARLTHRRPDGSVVEYPLSSSNSQTCANVDETLYDAIVPAAHRLAWTGALTPQKHRFDISVRSGSRTGGYSFYLDAQPPPRWWRERPADAVRRVIESWTPAKVTLRTDIEPDPVVVSADLSEVDMGTVSNRNESKETWRGSQAGSGEASFSRQTNNRSKAANQDGSPASAQSSGIESTITIGPKTIIDTGWVPLFRAAWGIPPIAAATFGIDAFFVATLLVQMQNSLSFDGGLASSLTVTPQVEAAIKAFLNVSAILGFVDLTASFTPSFALAMPVQVTNGQSVDTDECFRFRMDVAYEVTVGLCFLCVTASDQATLFTKRVPSGCTIPNASPLAPAAAPSRLADFGILRRAPASVAFDALGAGGMARVGDSGLLELRPWTAGAFGPAQALPGPVVGASNVQHAYFATGRAVMVYERSNLSAAAFMASTLPQAAASRSMAFRVLQNNTWGAEQALTAPGTGGEGQVALASCPAGRSGCPAGGEVLAAWIRNPGGDPFSYRYEVWHAFYRNGAWTVPARVADPGAGADMHPRVAYVGGTPVVSFTRSSARSIDAQATRVLMMRLLPSGNAFEVPDTSGVQWQSITEGAAGQLVIAFTRLPTGAAAISNQAVLWAARGTCTTTSCSFDVRQQRDAIGRSIRAEAPVAQRLGDGSVRIAYTGLGYGPNAQGVRVAPGDTVGLITGLGELAQLTPSFTVASALPQALTGDGKLYKNVALAQHPVSKTLVVLADQSTIAPVPADLVRKAVTFEPSRPALKGVPVGDSTVQFALPDAPDFAIDELLPQFDRVEPDTMPVVDVAIRNSGRAWVPDGRTDLRIEAAWDGPPGVGAPAGFALVTAIPDSGVALVRITLRAPADAVADQPRSLHVRINADGALAESDAGNNDASTVVGRLPAPQLLTIEERRLDRLVLLAWERPQDDRIVGYRIWRARVPAAGQAPQWFPVGSSFSESFVDLTGDAGQDDLYQVTAFSAGGIESPPSGSARATRDVTPPELIFAASYEGPPDVRTVRPVAD